MRLSVGQKIFSIAAVILALMIVVAAVSVSYISDLRRHLHTVATLQVPTSEAMARVNVRVLEQGLLMDQLLAFSEDSGESDDLADILPIRKRFMRLTNEVAEEFSAARRLLDQEAKSHVTRQQVVQMLDRDLDTIRKQVGKFTSHGIVLVEMLMSGDRAAFRKAFPMLSEHQSAIDDHLDGLRDHVTKMSDRAVAQAEKDERVILILNSVLTGLAVLLGLLFSVMVTSGLVRSVRNLVGGTRAVEAGDLDVALEKRTEDEIGELTVAFNTMVGGLRLKERIKDTFGKYMDPRIVADLVDNPEFVEPGGERREMTVLFADLQGFTAISESLPPDDLVNLVNVFFGHMTEAVGNHQGVIDKFMGDAVMAYWGPPFTADTDQARLACEAALDAVARLDDLRADLGRVCGDALAGFPIDIRIGISSGPMVVGTVGSKAARSSTVIGDPVNLGARLESANKAYGTRILIAERTRDLAGEPLSTREIDLIRVKGKSQPARVFELTPHDETDNEKVRTAFQNGLAAYREQDWDRAEAAFGAVLAEMPEDRPSLVYLERIAHLRKKAPPGAWDGVWIFDTK